MGISDEPSALSPALTNLPDGFSLQTITLEDAAVSSQYQTLITLPMSEIVVLDQSQVKSLLSPDISLVMAPGTELNFNQSSGQTLLHEPTNMVIYVPQDVTLGGQANSSETDLLIARQWYEDSLVATQALSSLTQVLTQVYPENGELVTELEIPVLNELTQ